mgnify:CR=1 FL=1
MRIHNVQNYNINNRPAFGSKIVPNETMEKLLNKVIRETPVDWEGLGEDNKNLLECLKGILNDGKNDVVEFLEDKNGIAKVKVNGKSYRGTPWRSNYIFTREPNGASQKYDGHGTFEQIIDFGTKEKGVKLPYTPHQRSAVILKEDEIYVLHELNKFRALSPAYEMFFVQAKNLLFSMKFNVRENLTRNLKSIKTEIFGK